MLLSSSCSVSALMKSSNSRSPGGNCVEGLTQEGAGTENKNSVTLLALGEKTKIQKDIANIGRENKNSVTLLTLGEKTKTQCDIANTGRENKNTVGHC